MSAFSVLPTIDGYDVIDNATGHPVDHRDTARSAHGVAYALNGATLATPGSPGSLANAWGTRRPYERTSQGFATSDLRDAARRGRPEDY